MKKTKIEIEKLKEEIVERLKPLNPDKIILFGSYAYGEPNEDSDIDLFLIKDEDIEVEALMRLRDLMKKEKIGFDVLSDSRENVENREDYFYKIDILQKGKVLYAK
ncbi:nucleotidyltransferase domain-containing protein [Hydrogenimonas thermophila]|uniref:nucleotidyltransferase domain-containing protein n=1 Tax=Hydrogenimonas thermophila TaxID=223786 RepID=UPI0029370301|nr:nucleotidyltransferase domain-containing protein [Hydrogenimonas thermophila]WOE69049.1 nucleotidyltransferase domain-containing protein [Hydrogenimonas thermophila]WOE71559.1 nucleotidyltransferase domain-containing protein [Hydrogenimonas thermophila]